jgi:hypothetical protein
MNASGIINKIDIWVQEVLAKHHLRWQICPTASGKSEKKIWQTLAAKFEPRHFLLFCYLKGSSNR